MEQNILDLNTIQNETPFHRWGWYQDTGLDLYWYNSIDFKTKIEQDQEIQLFLRCSFLFFSFLGKPLHGPMHSAHSHFWCQQQSVLWNSSRRSIKRLQGFAEGFLTLNSSIHKLLVIQYHCFFLCFTVHVILPNFPYVSAYKSKVQK